ncbi:MAG: DHA2 family efflux MFS transporter permease subunit [Bacteroidota bacterium]|nr:DHA2 family efflux MFS transporter permease subunit [Bacteroidota bacterium]
MRKLTPSHRIRKAIRGRNEQFHPSHHRYKWWVLINVMIGTFMAVLDSTIVNVGLPKIMASFGVGIDKIEWVVTAYMLSLAVALPTSGWMADRFGNKKMYFWGMLLFTVGSFLCGISGNENALIISRVIQGLGAGCIMPIGMAIVSREFPPERRGVALGFWAIAAAASVSFGPLIGGYLVDNFSWPLIFDVNVPVGIFGLLVTIIIQREYKNPRVRNFDWIGFISVSIFLPLILYALTEGNAATNSQGWHAPYILICFAISFISLAVFITTEFVVKEPLIDLRLLGNYNFGMANIVMFVFGIGMFGSTFLLPLYLQNSLNYTAIQSGAVFMPVGILQGLMSPIAGLWSNKSNPKIPMVLGVVLLGISFFMNGFLTYLTEHDFIMLTLYMRGFAMGVLFTPLTSVAMLELPPHKMSQASGLFNVIRQLGGSFGVAILSTLLTTRLIYHTQMYGGAIDPNSQTYQNVKREVGYHVQHEIGSSPAAAAQLSQQVVSSQVTKEAYIQGIDDDFLVAGFFTVIGVVPILLLHTRKKNAGQPVRQ